MSEKPEIILCGSCMEPLDGVQRRYLEEQTIPACPECQRLLRPFPEVVQTLLTMGLVSVLHRHFGRMR